MNTVTEHRCGRQHRAWPALARCMWQHAAWISGTGPFAVVAWCGVVTIRLHEDVVTAERALEVVDGTGCGGRCTGRHELVLLAFGRVNT